MGRNVFILCWLVLLTPAAVTAWGSAEEAGPVLAGEGALASGTVVAVPAGLAETTGVTECPELEAPVTGNSSWAWRLRAYRYLDCVTAIVERALGGTAAKSGAAAVESNKEPAPGIVSISRAELDRIRDLAWWARDAAARIGQ